MAKEAESLCRYVGIFSVPFLLQPFVDLPLEAGIFYARLPDEPAGCITGIVAKSFGQVTGDGILTVGALVQQDERLRRQIGYLQTAFAHQWEAILPRGEDLLLIPFGNHARGAAFFNASHQADSALTQWVDELAKQIPGFYFGRFDIKFKSWDALRQGLQYQIIEVNGSGSEPTHIYDPRQTVGYARREIIRHWWMAWEIAQRNRRHGYKGLSFWQGIQLLRQNRQWLKKVKKMHKGLMATP